MICQKWFETAPASGCHCAICDMAREEIERERDKRCATTLAEWEAEAARLVLQLPCRCLNLGDGEYVECDRCLFLHGATVRETDAHE